MPIYAYRCQRCGFAKDVLQKVSDAPLTECPSCQQPAFKKQLTAAGFQLKGTGWYATDFRGGAASSTTPTAADAAPTDSSTASSTASTSAPAAADKAGSATPSAT
jgi:putative FmdB family regulatory protein